MRKLLAILLILVASCASAKSQPAWLKDAVIYHIYPSTYMDSNGDGIGDLKGIIEKLYYIKELGVNAIWVNPFFKSPFMDGGYDVEDYYAVDEKFGTINHKFPP